MGIVSASSAQSKCVAKRGCGEFGCSGGVSESTGEHGVAMRVGGSVCVPLVTVEVE
jgi:hypothetical protein